MMNEYISEFDSTLKYTVSENFGLITKTIRNATSTLYSNAIDISKQKQKGMMPAVFMGSTNEDFEDLKVIKKIGQGGFSEVYQAIDSNTKKEYAMRLCTIDGKTFTHERASREIEVYNQLRHLDHPNIAKIYSAKLISSVDDGKEVQSLQVVMELGVCNLEEIIKHRIKIQKAWTEIELVHISLMLVHPMMVAKEHEISHRDISLNNVILSKDLKLYKLIDFAEAKTTTNDLENVVGKTKYMAPEITSLIQQIQSGDKGGVAIKYDVEKADVYALGILIGSLGCMEMLGATDSPAEFSRKLGKIQSEYPKIHSMVIDMVNPNPMLRKDFRKLFEYLSQFKGDVSKLPFYELEFESGLQLNPSSISRSEMTKTFERTFQEWNYKGDINMRNNLFGEAIMCYLKVYEMIKRGEIPLNKE